LVTLFVSTNKLIGQGFYITSSDNTKLYVQEFGSGEPIIMLAGGPGLNAVYMKPVWEKLSAKYRCIVLDQRGTGKSELAVVDSSTVSVNKYLSDLESLRKYLKIDRLTLVGHSWGGMLSMEYAARYPDHIKRLILLAPGGPTKKFFAYFGDNIDMRLREEDMKEAAELDSLKKPQMKGYWPGYFYDRKRAMATKSAVNFEELAGNHPGLFSLVMASYVFSENERTRLLKNFKGAVCIIQGRQDPIGESTVYEIKELLPQSHIHFIEKCGHLPWLENKEQAENFFNTLNDCLK
jgi:proline iminopeptidase